MDGGENSKNGWENYHIRELAFMQCSHNRELYLSVISVMQRYIEILWMWHVILIGIRHDWTGEAICVRVNPPMISNYIAQSKLYSYCICFLVCFQAKLSILL